MTKTTTTCDVCGAEMACRGIDEIALRGAVFNEKDGAMSHYDFTIEPHVEHKSMSDICKSCVTIAVKQAINQQPTKGNQ